MEDEPAIRVLLLEDERAPAEAIAAYLTHHGLVVVAVLRLVEEVLDYCEKDRPDVVVADINLGHRSAPGAEWGVRLALNLPSLLADDGPPILWWSGHEGRHRVAAYLAGGAGFIDKNEQGLEELVDAIHRVAGGEMVWTLADKRAAEKAPKPPTKRQFEVLRAVETGLTNKEIGAHLDIKERTVEKHLQDMYDRYGVDNRSELVRLARVSGWVLRSATSSDRYPLGLRDY